MIGTIKAEFDLSYQEGIWKGELKAAGSGPLALVANQTEGYFVKIGKAVTITGLFSVSSVTDPLGHLTIEPLPFPAVTTGHSRLAVALSCEQVNQGWELEANIQGGNQILIYRNIGGAASDAAPQLTNSSSFWINATYFTDS